MAEKMKPETLERIWQTLEPVMQEASGEQPYAEAIAEIRSLLRWLSDAFDTAATKEQMLSWLAQMDEPSQEHVEAFEAMARYAAPILYKAIRGMAQQGLKRIPKQPGGRPVRCTAEEKQALCQEILRRVGNGCSVAEAKRRVARQQRLGGKTVDRIWAGRSGTAVSLMSMGEVEVLLQSLIGGSLIGGSAAASKGPEAG